jgi:hypothetical protein
MVQYRFLLDKVSTGLEDHQSMMLHSLISHIIVYPITPVCSSKFRGGLIFVVSFVFAKKISPLE